MLNWNTLHWSHSHPCTKVKCSIKFQYFTIAYFHVLTLEQNVYSFSVSIPFTRDFDSIRSKLLVLEEGDKTCIDTAFLGVNQLVLNEWGGCQTPVQIILV